jgi:hypothetical protein
MAKSRLKPPLPSVLPAPLLQAIGAVVTNWAGLEASLEIAICDLYEVRRTKGLIFTANIGFSARLSLIRISAATDNEMTSEPEGDTICRLLPRLEKAFGERNKTAHAVWGRAKSPAAGSRMYIRARGDQLKTVHEEISVRELERTAARAG